jgi:hypothetical protein
VDVRIVFNDETEDTFYDVNELIVNDSEDYINIIGDDKDDVHSYEYSIVNHIEISGTKRKVQ